MGDGWETKRRRAPGFDWCILALGQAGLIEKLKLIPHTLKATSCSSIDSSSVY
jgi:allantoicase